MKISDLTVEVRNANLARVGQIMPEYLVGLEVVSRFNAVGGWKLNLPADHPMADALRAPGAGIIVTGASGVLLSGPTVTAKSVKTAEDPEGVWEITGVDDSTVLRERVAYPSPATSDLTAQGDYDVRTGKAETVMKAYVNANVGPSAPAARKITGLTVEADLARGATVTGRARFDQLGTLLDDLAVTSGLGFDLVQVGSGLQFKVYQPADRSATIRMDIDNNRLTKSEYSYTAPQATRVIVAGQGSGSSRTLLERSSAGSVSAETSWGRRIEVFKDQRNTGATAELQQAGDEILAEKGATVEAVSVTPSDDDVMNYPADWALGDKVSVVVGDLTIVQVVSEVAIVVTDEGVKVGATVGDPRTASQDDTESQLVEVATDHEDRISNLERNESRVIPAGVISQFAGGNAPSGYLLCTGGAVSRTTYADLFAVIGTTYGAGNGSTTFNLPNLQGRVPVGWDPSQPEFDVMGETGGAKTHTLTSAEMPPHGHSFSANTNTTGAHEHEIEGPAGHTLATNFGGGTLSSTFAFSPSAVNANAGYGARRWFATSSGNHFHTFSGNTAATGNGGAHNNLQPYITLQYIIKT
jgi:microcystin-dependent protein